MTKKEDTGIMILMGILSAVVLAIVLTLAIAVERPAPECGAILTEGYR